MSDVANETPALTATEMVRRIREGEITAAEVVEACLARIDADEERVQAWEVIARDHARKQAEIADRARKRGAPLGSLHGVPVGIKDIFDTFDMPTQNGTPLHKDRQPRKDAAAVERLREAGAIILGKTVTTELAVYHPGKTRNPHNPAHTPGGSSSGSAAAVAAGMVPLALGTQTNGSVIRPASFCGVFGYKPSFGSISRRGCLMQSPSLDHPGVFAGTLEDAALMAESLMAYDAEDGAMRMRARPALRQAAVDTPPVPPMLAFCKTPVWDQADADTQAAFAELVEVLGDDVNELELPQSFNSVHEMHRVVMESDLARNFAREYERGRDQLSAKLVEMIERGQQERAVDYARAIDGARILNNVADGIFSDFDAIVTPATPGEAPHGLDATGNPTFCTIWTYTGMPAVSIPLFTGSNGLPIGVQLVAAHGDDARLMRTANWLIGKVNGAA
ncbi:amidase [Ferruginivarius sediminum]|nr:amidase [Ferruginivarius sediminum]